VTVEALADAGEQGSLNRAVTQAAEAVGAEIAIAIRGGSVIASGGRVTGGPARFDLLALAGTNEPVEVPGIGVCRVLAIGNDPEPGVSLVVARRGTLPFTDPEVAMLRSVAQLVALTSRMPRELESTGAPGVTAGRELLERLSTIQQPIPDSGSLQGAFDAVTSGAATLLGDGATVVLRLIDSDDPSFATAVSFHGHQQAVFHSLTRLPATAGLAGKVCTAGHLIVEEDYPSLPYALPALVAVGVQASMGTPIREAGRVVGSLLVSSDREGISFSLNERAALRAFAEHASLVLTNSRRVEAMREQAALAKLLQRVAGAANEADNIEQAVRTCLELVCSHTGWVAGHGPCGCWYVTDAERFRAFQTAAEQAPFRFEEKLPVPGDPPAGPGPSWIADLPGEGKRPEQRSAAAAGLRSAFSFPVISREEAVGTVEFFSTKVGLPDVSILDAMAQVGSQLGQTFERNKAERALRESEERFRRLAENAKDLIFRYRLKPAPAGFEYVSPSSTEITGYTPEEHYADPDIGRRMVHHADRHLLEMTMTGERAGRRLSMRWIRKDSSIVWTEHRTVPVHDRDGTLVAIEGIIRDVTEAKRAEQQTAHLIRTLRDVDAERRHLLARCVNAQEEESSRIAADIHDDSIQVMAVVSIRLGMLAMQLSDPVQLRTVGKLQEAVELSVNKLRRLMFDLRPLALDRGGLAVALREHLEPGDGETGLAFEIQDNFVAEPPPQTRVILYRVAQEALANVRKHSAAGHVSIALETLDRGCLLRITDDGVGFSAGERAESPLGHMGLTAMRERAEMAGGWARISSEPGQGTTIECWVPPEIPPLMPSKP
jgi:PAS domain S-box-containing protein